MINGSVTLPLATRLQPRQLSALQKAIGGRLLSTSITGHWQANGNRDEVKLYYRQSDSPVHPSVVGRVRLIYRPDLQALSLYTCEDLCIIKGQKLAMEVISRAFLTAERIIRSTGRGVKTIYAFYRLAGYDYDERSGNIKLELEQRIDHLYGILGGIGLTAEMPAGMESYYSPRGKMTSFDQLRHNYQRNWWQWCYESRLRPEVADLLDREVVAGMTEVRDLMEWAVIRGQLKTFAN